MLFLLFALASAACHPECRWACDDPVCHAACTPACAPADCRVCTNGTDCRALPWPFACTTRCPADQCESDACPACETVCPDVCGAAPGCAIECAAPQCAWRCALPAACAAPRCELACEAPACPASGATRALAVPLLALAVTMGTVFA